MRGAVPPRRAPVDLPETPGRLLALGAAAGLALMAATTSGDALFAGVLLGLAAADVAAGVTGVLVAVSVAGRWGLASLVALAGGQAVVGAAGWSGSPAMVLSSWAAAAAVVLACPRRPKAKGAAPASLPGAVACGLFAAALVAGPAGGWSSTSVVALRVVASVLGTAATLVVARILPRRAARVLGLLAATGAAAIALVA